MKNDLISASENLLPDGTGSLTPERRGQLIDLAMVEFNKLRSLTVVADAPGTDTIALPLPEKFADDSKILMIQRFDDGAVVWTPILPIDYMIQQTPTGRELVFIYETDASATYRIKFTMPYVVSDTEDTLPISQRQAVLAYTCYLCALVLAGEHAQDIDNSFNSATVQRGTSASEYRKLADIFLVQWKSLMGIPLNERNATGTAVAYTTATWTRDNRHMLFH